MQLTVTKTPPIAALSRSKWAQKGIHPTCKRSLISQYTLDKQKAPQALDDLITAGYLKQIPIDPMTNARDTWTVDQEDTLLSVDQQEPGISDVHSGSNAISSDGTAYSTW